MFPSLCLTIAVFIALFILGGILLPIALVFKVLLITSPALYICVFTVYSLCVAETHHAADCARRMWEKRNGKTPDLPKHLKGVFWFATNKAPELLMTFEGENWNAEKRQLTITSGGVYNWTYSTGIMGWVYWLMLRFTNAACAKLYVNFQDEELTFAHMPLYIFGCIPLPMGMYWDLKQIDENNWDRPIYLCCTPNTRWETGSYTLKRIIGPDGEKTPAFDEMVLSVEKGIDGIPKKPAMQIMTGAHCCSCFSDTGKEGLEPTAASETRSEIEMGLLQQQ